MKEEIFKQPKHTDNESINAVKNLDGGFGDNLQRIGHIKSNLYNWQSEYGGIELSQIKHMRDLEE